MCDLLEMGEEEVGKREIMRFNVEFGMGFGYFSLFVLLVGVLFCF